ncbi:thiopeptide-type bacteriocin biosynthesis protein [Actinoplanes sp. NPDC051859]|uniref:thiopeptide-type bacteriocin biosynthesis protein n=1 Tax=Actinoplanes sp. NPDC051859 TaxID=3363909 RepID=UPI0037A07DB8
MTWSQITLYFPDPARAEPAAVAHVVPLLTAAEHRRLIAAWFVVRKGHQWRLRYLPTRGRDAGTWLLARLTAVRRAGHLTAARPSIYEPEIYAFGGPTAMAIAHRLWHLDSRHLLTAPTDTATGGRRRELSIVLCTALMRAAGLDWYEQGDVWARTAEHRDPADPAHVDTLQEAVHRLLAVDPDSLTHAGAPLAAARAWLDAYTAAGAALGRLHHRAELTRGLREVITHHVVFTWNRRGIPEADQAALAAAAQTVIFGPQAAATAGVESR